MIVIDHEKCCWKNGECSDCGTTCKCEGGCTTTSGGCIDVCPVNAISRKDVLIIDPEACCDCGSCVEECPKGALSIE